MRARTHTQKHRLKKLREVVVYCICDTRLIGLATACTSVVGWCTWWCNHALTLCRSCIKRNLHMALPTHYFPRRGGSASVSTGCLWWSGTSPSACCIRPTWFLLEHKLIPKNAEVLDLMSSWINHLPGIDQYHVSMTIFPTESKVFCEGLFVLIWNFHGCLASK